MNYTQDELKEIQAIHNVKDNELGTRMPTEQEFQAFNATIQELWEQKGFVVSKDNFLKLWLAFDANPNIPITRGNILETTKVYRDQYAWKSAEEVEFRKLSEQIGPDQTELVIKQLGRHGLINTAGTEELFNNFNQVVRFYQSQGWSISADSFQRAIGNLQSSLKQGVLFFRPTPYQQALTKRWETTRASEGPKKSPLEIAKAKAESVKHVMNPDGTRLSDQIMREFYEAHPEALETETAEQAPAKPVDAAEKYWEQQVKQYIETIARPTLRAEAAQLFGQKLYDSWRATHRALDTWYGNRAPGKPQRVVLDSVVLDDPFSKVR